MKKTPVALALSFAGLLAFVAGCSPEEKAKSTLQKYEAAFNICKEETEKTKMQPGEHRCALVSSMALDMSMNDTGLDEAKIKSMRDEWLEKTGYKPFYIPADKRGSQK